MDMLYLLFVDVIKPKDNSFKKVLVNAGWNGYYHVKYADNVLANLNVSMSSVHLCIYV